MNITLRTANYIARYAPSRRKITEYLTKKKYNGDISTFLIEIHYSEELMMAMWIRTFLARSIGERDMRLKLMKKGFSRELIEEKIMTSSEEIRDWSSHQKEIEMMIHALTRKGKSLQFISMTLRGKYPYFQDEISEILESESDDTGLQREIEKYKTKYNLSNPSEKQKFYSAIQRKGFRYDDIKNALRKETQENLM